MPGQTDKVAQKEKGSIPDSIDSEQLGKFASVSTTSDYDYYCLCCLRV